MAADLTGKDAAWAVVVALPYGATIFTLCPELIMGRCYHAPYFLQNTALGVLFALTIVLAKAASQGLEAVSMAHEPLKKNTCCQYLLWSLTGMVVMAFCLVADLLTFGPLQESSLLKNALFALLPNALEACYHIRKSHALYKSQVRIDKRIVCQGVGGGIGHALPAINVAIVFWLKSSDSSVIITGRILSLCAVVFEAAFAFAESTGETAGEEESSLKTPAAYKVGYSLFSCWASLCCAFNILFNSMNTLNHASLPECVSYNQSILAQVQDSFVTFYHDDLALFCVEVVLIIFQAYIAFGQMQERFDFVKEPVAGPGPGPGWLSYRGFNGLKSGVFKDPLLSENNRGGSFPDQTN